jgi:hypothetical protein
LLTLGASKRQQLLNAVNLKGPGSKRKLHPQLQEPFMQNWVAPVAFSLSITTPGSQDPLRDSAFVPDSVFFSMPITLVTPFL